MKLALKRPSNESFPLDPCTALHIYQHWREILEIRNRRKMERESESVIDPRDRRGRKLPHEGEAPTDL